MKISIREALFGGEELDDWEPPKSNWIVLLKLGEAAWTDEAVSMFPKAFPEKWSAANFLEITIKANIYNIEDDEIQINQKYTDTGFSPYSGFSVYFNPDNKIIAITRLKLTEEELQTKLVQIDAL